MSGPLVHQPTRWRVRQDLLVAAGRTVAQHHPGEVRRDELRRLKGHGFVDHLGDGAEPQEPAHGRHLGDQDVHVTGALAEFLEGHLLVDTVRHHVEHNRRRTGSGLGVRHRLQRRTVARRARIADAVPRHIGDQA